MTAFGTEDLERQIFDASPIAMSITRLADRRIVQINRTYEQLFQVKPASIIGRTPHDVGIGIPGGLRERILRNLEGGVEVRGHEAEISTPAGLKTVMLWTRRIELAGEPHALFSIMDVTEHRRASEQARSSDERLRELAANVHEVFWLTDPGNTTMFYVSPAYEKIFGRTCASLYADPRTWLEAIYVDDRPRMAEASLHLGEGPKEDTYRIVVRGAVRTIRISTVPVREDGQLVRIAGVAEDITERLELEAQYKQTQKLESLGMLAGGVAHDFNNVLAVIGANVGLLGEAIGPGHPDRELIDDVESAVKRATGLTRQLLAFSRKEVVEPVVLDLNAVVGDTRKMLRRMVGEDVVIETSLDPELACVRIDPGYFVQILMNLAVNARDAMPRGGRLSITTRNQGSDVLIEVADTGCGMSPDVLSRVFEPFFSTKDVGKGTGLGLSVVHGIVQQAGGRIAIESRVDVGTAFRITLPIIDAPPERLSDLSASAATGSEKVLLVDDDVFVRRATSRALRSRGYTVLEASDGHAALRLLEDQGRDVALLVTDVIMPNMDGRELSESARRQRPSLKVLYMSGYTDDAIIRHGLEHDQIPFIEKPFRSHSLAAKVRRLIDGVAP